MSPSTVLALSFLRQQERMPGSNRYRQVSFTKLKVDTASLWIQKDTHATVAFLKSTTFSRRLPNKIKYGHPVAPLRICATYSTVVSRCLVRLRINTTPLDEVRGIWPGLRTIVNSDSQVLMPRSGAHKI